MTVAVVIVAAGRGTRAADVAASSSLPKQFAKLGGQPMLTHTLAAFLDHRGIDCVLVARHPDDAAHYAAAIDTLPAATRHSLRLLPAVIGGASRQDTVRHALEQLATLPAPPTIVLIHDAARPFIDSITIDAVVASVRRSTGGRIVGALPTIAVSDSLKRVAADGEVVGSVDRAGLHRAQTPQGFLFTAILDAHRRAADSHQTGMTDDAALAQWAGYGVAAIAGKESNVKITTTEDLARAQIATRDSSKAVASPNGGIEFRSGTGFDVHRFAEHTAESRGVWLCGVEIPHPQRLDGHSDADVALHALTDALLGAIGAGDIGIHFPPSDARWKGVASHIFLSHAARLIAERSGRIVNVDVTILAESPKIAPHREVLCAKLAALLGLRLDQVSVKATTTEGLGFTGRREGIATMACATVAIPARSES